MAGDAAQKAANKVNPSDEALAQIDRPAADNTWHDTPDLSASSLKNQMKDMFNKNTSLTTQDLRDAAGETTETSGIQSGINTLKDRASDNIDDDTKDKIKDAKNATQERTMNYLRKKMPEERRDQTIWRLKKMVVEIQGHPDCECFPPGSSLLG